MKKRIKELGLKVFVFGMLLLVGSSLLFAQKPMGWFIAYGPLEGTEGSLSTDSHTGKYSAYVKTTGSQKGQGEDWKQGGWIQGWSYNITSLLEPNSEYILAGWVKTNLKEGSEVGFSVHLHDKSQGKTSAERFHGFDVGNMKGMNNWTYKQTVIKTPDTIQNAHIHFIVNKAGEAWLDDVVLIDVSTKENLLDNPGFEIIEGEEDV